MKLAKKGVRDLVESVIEKYDGDLSMVSGLLGISDRTLYRWRKGTSVPLNSFIRQMREIVRGSRGDGLYSPPVEKE